MFSMDMSCIFIIKRQVKLLNMRKEISQNPSAWLTEIRQPS
ncbi:hypothetical protein SVI_1069 [Shewanella violacea DSS12]|uniref:Uncharacterized protein n=1 Tax=Shewanella violacea (strain JCM 10179 / CIP 106290 / LMG 19151 / DSS12) TaxID=637905 RepID=D4ZH91_SHEVD|nr:hypothetical protein SVI_1069 [Shewanella violacea DSS12]